MALNKNQEKYNTINGHCLEGHGGSVETYHHMSAIGEQHNMNARYFDGKYFFTTYMIYRSTFETVHSMGS